MGYGEVLSLPISVFWLMFRNVNRIQAEDDHRSVMVAVSANATGNGITELLDKLEEEQGEVFVISNEYVAENAKVAEPEEGAFDKLRSMMF